MKESLNITLIQSDLFWEDIDSNLFHFEALISKIASTDIILLPEMFNTGFSVKSTHLSEKMDGKTVSWMRRVSREKGSAIAGSLMVRENGKIYNRLVWISKKGEVAIYDKSHLFSLIKEEKTITKGTERLIINIDGWKVCPLICYDLRFPVFSRNNVDYDLLIYLASWPKSRIDAWDTLLKARSIENQCYTIGVNRIGVDKNGSYFNGHSLVFNGFGEKVLSAIENKEQILQVDLSLNDLKLKRRKMNFLQDRDKFIIQ